MRVKSDMRTEYYRITDFSGPDMDAIRKAGQIIASGGLVAFPTETVYGLGGSALSADSAGKIYRAKGRPSDNPLIVHISDIKDAEKIAYVNEAYYALAEAFMPGPLTVVMHKKDIIPDAVTGGLDSVAVRYPDNRVALELIKAAGVPVAAPSANSSGMPSPTTAGHVMNDLDGKIDMILDYGECSIGVESTVISLKDNGCEILRPGAVTADMLHTVLKDVGINPAVINPSEAGDRPRSPGMKYRHYSPRAEVILVDLPEDRFIDYVNSVADDKTGVFATEKEAEKFRCTVLLTGDDYTPEELNHSVFGLLRKADDLELGKVYVKLPPAEGAYLALYNRLIRSAAGKILRPDTEER